MTRNDLPEVCVLRPKSGGEIKVYFEGKTLFFSITNANNDSGWIELGENEIVPLFEGFVAMTLGISEGCSVDLGDRRKEADAETLEACSMGSDYVDVLLHLWGDPENVDEDDDDASTFEVRLEEWEFAQLYVLMTAVAISEGMFGC